MSRSREVKTYLPYLFMNPRGPAPRHPEGLQSQPRPALPPKRRGPRLGDPEAGPRSGHNKFKENFSKKNPFFAKKESRLSKNF